MSLIKLFKRPAMFVIAATVFSGPVFANIIFDSTQANHGTGFGTQNNILTLHNNGANGNSSASETGKVAWNGTSDVLTGADVVSGSGKTATFSFGDLGITNSGQILLIWNPNEGGNDSKDDTQIDSLILSIYEPNANPSVVFSDSLASPMHHDSLTNPGLGGDDFAYVLDDNGISDLNSVLLGIGDFSDYRIGLSSTVSFVDAGPDTWTIGSRPYDSGTSDVPEPASAGLLGLALVGIALFLRRRQNHGRSPLDRTAHNDLSSCTEI